MKKRQSEPRRESRRNQWLNGLRREREREKKIFHRRDRRESGLGMPGLGEPPFLQAPFLWFGDAENHRLMAHDLIVVTTGARCHLNRERGKTEQVSLSSLFSSSLFSPLSSPLLSSAGSLSHLQFLRAVISASLCPSSFLSPSTHSEENSLNPISDITSSSTSNLVDVVSDSIIIFLGS